MSRTDPHVGGRLCQIAETQTSHLIEVRSVASSEAKLMFDSGCCDEGVGETNPALSTDPPGSFRHGTVDGNLSKRCQQCAHQIGSCIAGKEFSPGDYRVMQPVPAGSELLSSSQVIDQNVGVDEDVSHGPIRLDWAPWRRVLLQRLLQARVLDQGLCP